MQWKEVFRGTARVERNDFATMSGPPRVRTMNVCPEPDPRPVLGPTGNTAPVRRPTVKPFKKAESVAEPRGEMESKQKNKSSSVVVAQSPKCGTAASFLRRQEVPMNASWSSDASSSSDSSRSSGRIRTLSGKKGIPPEEKSDSNCAVVVGDNCGESKKRCAWITPDTDPCYTTFHDEEWGVPVHDDKKLFELLSLSGALAELTWPVILKKRHVFREVFLDFDPIAVSSLNEKKIATPGSPAGSLLSELKLRSIIENACQMCKVVEEFGSFDKYIWSFVSHEPIVSQFRYSRQVPVKTPKAEVISKDLVRRGFRSVGPTVIYSFMQVAGLTNDHLTSCFRFHECTSVAE